MRVHVYEQLMAMQRSRRDVLKGAAGAAATLAASSTLLSSTPSFAEDSVVAQIMKIPGAGNGSPTDADWQKVGALCLGPTKANVKQGEFAGVEFSFMGLNNQNLHNFLFRGFLTPWEQYTGAIDQVDRPRAGRLQRPSSAIDRDRHGRLRDPRDGRAFRRRHGRQGPALGHARLGEDADRFRRLRRLPEAAGRHLERQDPSRHHRQRLPHDELPHRRLRRSPISPSSGRTGRTRPVSRLGASQRPGSRCRRSPSSSRARRSAGKEVYGFLDQPKGWGGFGFYFTGSRATAYAKYPGEKNWLFDENMKPLVNNPAWVRAIQDVIDALPYEPADQINADPGTTAFQQFLPGTGSLLEWWGDIGSMANTSDTSVIGKVRRLRHPAGLGRRLQLPQRGVGEAAERAEPFAEHGLSRLGHLCDEVGRQGSEAAEGRVERGGSPRRQGPVDVDGGLSVRLPALPQEPHKYRSLGDGRLRLVPTSPPT